MHKKATPIITRRRQKRLFRHCSTSAASAANRVHDSGCGRNAARYINHKRLIALALTQSVPASACTPDISFSRPFERPQNKYSGAFCSRLDMGLMLSLLRIYALYISALLGELSSYLLTYASAYPLPIHAAYLQRPSVKLNNPFRIQRSSTCLILPQIQIPVCLLKFRNRIRTVQHHSYLRQQKKKLKGSASSPNRFVSRG